ncbi:MAG: TlyA family RNA methyltransferase [Thermodesulfobacteriota bacterium]
MPKVRADQLLVDKGLASSRAQARVLIMAGLILADGRLVEKAGQTLDPQADLALKVQASVFVSRGGLKLEGALEDFNLDVSGMKALDIGASTGGFTDCLLKRGAAEVVAVDVGRGLLDWRLRQDSRVKVLERTNARYLTSGQVGKDFDLVVIDVSFISLALILPAVENLVRPESLVLALVKPQFEVGPEKVGRGGVVRDPRLQAEAVAAVSVKAGELGFEVLNQAPSRRKGPKGNQEHFLLLRKTGLKPN